MYEVYIHVPFCTRRCGYCDFNTYTSKDLGEGASRGNYASMAITEMRLIKRWQYDHSIFEPAASTVFFGGGTPTLLSPKDLGAMLHAVDDLWGLAPDAEITTEANPDTVDYDIIAALADQGFNRISFGMQSAVPSVLRTLDRTHTPANVTAGVRATQRLGIRSSVDLIYGTPGEGMGDWRYSVRAALDLQVDHISAYALTLEPTTKMGRQVGRGILPRPDDDDEAAKYEIADDMFTSAGLPWYEISNWARPGYESRHNLGYWRNVDWAGIGPGAHSHYNRHAPGRPQHTQPLTEPQRSEAHSVRRDTGFLPVRVRREPGTETYFPVDGRNVGLRAWDIRHPRRWAHAINADRVPWEGFETISPTEGVEELIMLGLRLSEGLDLHHLADALGHPLNMPAIHALQDEGLITTAGSMVVATRRGRLLNDAVIQRMFSICGL